MKKNTKNGIKNITIEIIDYFLCISESLISVIDRKEFYRIINGYPAEKALTYSNISKIISNLSHRGYIEVQKADHSESIIFTNKAKLAVVEKLTNKNPQDNKFRFVSFDIPESKRLNRDQFRRAIKRMGFVQIQKSLWATNINVGDFVEMAANEYKVNEYIVYMVSEVTNIDQYLLLLLQKDA